MRNLKLTLAYDGTNFHGWQVQPQLRTVQGELERALRKLFNHDVAVTGSGRTDAGVHAHAQVANVESERTMDTGAVIRGANALLPDDIRVLSVEEVGADFHARRSARSKTYQYRVWRLPSSVRSSFVTSTPFAIPSMNRCSIVARVASLERMTSVPSVQRRQRSRIERVRFMKLRGHAPRGNGHSRFGEMGFCSTWCGRSLGHFWRSDREESCRNKYRLYLKHVIDGPPDQQPRQAGST